jgi:CTP synthase
MAEQMDVTDFGGTMRLGACPAMLDEGSIVAGLYGTTVVSERHRHRYEFNARTASSLRPRDALLGKRRPTAASLSSWSSPVTRSSWAPRRIPSSNHVPIDPTLFLGLIKAAAARAEGREPHIIDPSSVDSHVVSDSFHVEGAEIVFRSHVFDVEKTDDPSRQDEQFRS